MEYPFTNLLLIINFPVKRLFKFLSNISLLFFFFFIYIFIRTVNTLQETVANGHLKLFFFFLNNLASKLPATYKEGKPQQGKQIP